MKKTILCGALTVCFMLFGANMNAQTNVKSKSNKANTVTPVPKGVTRTLPKAKKVEAAQAPVKGTTTAQPTKLKSGVVKNARLENAAKKKLKAQPAKQTETTKKK